MANTATKKKSAVAEKYATRRRTVKQNEAAPTVKAIDLSNNLVYAVLEDNTIPFEQRVEKIVEMLTVDLESEETVQSSQENIAMVKDIVKELLNRFTQHNRKSIEFTRDNPLSQLKESIQEVFENYHAINLGRKDLKGKLSTVDKLIEQVGGEEKLVLALVEAKTRDNELKTREAEIEETTKAANVVTQKLRELETRARVLRSNLVTEKGRLFASLRGSVQAQITNLTEQLQEIETNSALAQSEKDELDNKLAVQREAIKAFKSTEDFRVHQEISRILDIASPKFKEQLTSLAEATLQYIDDTQNVMTQVRDQLELLMKDVDQGLNVNVNIREQVAILSGALQQASDKSSLKLRDFKAANNAEDRSDLARLEGDKIARAGDIFVSEISSTVASVTMISSEVQKIEVVLLSLRDQLSDGLSDADEQLVMAVNTASASGMVMLNRAQTLGTLAQAVISRGQYMVESEETFGQLAQEFERSLAVKAGRNDTINGLSAIISEITEAMDDRNDVAAAIAVERRELIGDLSNQIDRLRAVAEETRELESRVNTELAEAAQQDDTAAA